MSIEKALLGMHGDPMIAAAFTRTIKRKFDVEYVSDVEKMLVQCRQTEYGLYVMDLNFGQEAALDIVPAQRVYQLLQQRPLSGLEKRFIGISSGPDVVELAQQQGIPAVLKTGFMDYFNGLFPE